MIQKVLRAFLDTFVLSRGGWLSSKILSSKLFPWQLWNITFEGNRVLRGPIIVSDLQKKRFGGNFSSAGNLKLGGSLLIGNNVNTNVNVMFDASPTGIIEIGNGCLFAPNVVLRACNHRFSDISLYIRDQGHSQGTIKIQNDVWVGANSVILQNSKIGNGVVVGALSLVLGELPDYSVAVGSPVKIVRYRNNSELNNAKTA